jgi:Tfp pilus assembly protein PilN
MMPINSLAWHRHHRRRRTMRIEALLPWLADGVLMILVAASVLGWMFEVLT